MKLDTTTALITIIVVAIITLFTRVLPFAVFRNKKTPSIVLYLGKALPVAIIAMLIIYCLKNVALIAYPYGLPEAIAITVVVLLHLWKRNTLLSIFIGTAIYMVLIQFVFVV